MSKCNHCNGTGRLQNEIIIQPYGPTLDFCSCEKGEEVFKQWASEPEQRLKRETLKREKIEALLKKSQVGTRFRSKGIDDLADNKTLQKLCREYAEDFPKNKVNGWGFYFWGNIGSGKTHAAAAICNELIEKHFTEILFLNMSDVSNRVRGSFYDTENTDAGLFEEMKTIELLVIDDIGVEKVTEWLTEQLFLVINYRYENKLPIIVTSNQSLEDLSKIHRPQIASRIDEMCKSVKFKGADRRKERRPDF